MTTSNISLVVIKPLSVGRGDGPLILSMILDVLPVSLRFMRAWRICTNSYQALTADTNGIKSDWDFETESVNSRNIHKSWCCIFVHKDGTPYPFPKAFINALRKDCFRSNHPSDNVIQVTHPDRFDYEANILFENFNRKWL